MRSERHLATVSKSNASREARPEIVRFWRSSSTAAQLLSGCGRPFLRGDPSAFARARALRSERARAYTGELQLRGVLEAARAAWEERDYGRVHDLLNPLRDSLDEVHRRRLAFAQKRLR